jgi:hypothetical protein
MALLAAGKEICTTHIATPHFALHATNSQISGLRISPVENIPSDFTVQNQVPWFAHFHSTTI